MTIDSKLSGPAGRSSAPTVIARMCVAPTAVALARTTSVISGSTSTHHTSANEPRSGKASWPVPHARSSSRPRPEGAARRTRSAIIASG
ncbi:hypothetical protein O1M63_02735 [Streptomyces mirabilis]|nr:hypothetical protein [Streptomyces mirabilis]